MFTDKSEDLLADAHLFWSSCVCCWICCADCGTDQDFRAGDSIICRDCGYRIMYKKRTKNSQSCPCLGLSWHQIHTRLRPVASREKGCAAICRVSFLVASYAGRISFFKGGRSMCGFLVALSESVDIYSRL